MRLSMLMIGGMLVGTMAPAGDVTSLQGQLIITRTLTKQRVVLPAYSVRGVSPKRNVTASGPVNEWERVVVYLETDKAPAANKMVATLDQSGERFLPEVLAVPAGSSVSFPNSDPIFHNVFSLSKARAFDLGFYPSGQTRVVKFDKPGVVQVFCHLHPHMNATILVVPNAWHTRPGDNGAFSFSNVPAGSYRVVVWHKTAGLFKKQIQVSEDTIAKVSMEIPLGMDTP